MSSPTAPIYLILSVLERSKSRSVKIIILEHRKGAMSYVTAKQLG